MEILFIIAISVLMLVAPFYRGLYFRENYMTFTTIIGILTFTFVLYSMIKKKRIKINRFDVAIFLIPLCYFISFLFSINKKDAFDSFIKFLSYALFYFVVGQVCRNREDDRNFLFFKELIIFITLINAIMPVLNIAGIIDLKGIIVNNRVFGLYQYANTTASILATGIILALTSLDCEISKWKQIYYDFVLAINVPVFVMTLSRGAMLVFLIIWFLVFLINDRIRKIYFILNSFIMAISSVIVLYGYYNLLGNNKMIFTYCGLSIITSVLLQKASYWFLMRKINLVDNKTVLRYTAFIIIVIFVSILLLFSIKDYEYKVEHGPDEEKSWKYKRFDIEIIKPDSDYELSFYVKSSDDNPYSYGAIIQSVNENGERKQLYKEFSSVGDIYTYVSIPFRTLEDSKSLSILLYNYEKDSYTIYKDIKLTDRNGRIVKSFYELRYIPKVIVNRFRDFSLTTTNASLRLEFIKDSLNIFRDNIIFGAGGGAWKNLYRQYQLKPYNTSEVHNFYAQYADEVGIVGLLALIFLIAQLVNITCKAVKEKDYEKIYFYVAIWLLLLHSALDFNLSLSASAYMLWLMFGVASQDKNLRDAKISKNYAKLFILAFAFALFVLSSGICLAIKSGDTAGRLGITDIDRSIKLYERAMKLDRYNAAYRLDYSYLMMLKYLEKNDDIYETQFYHHMDKVLEYEPFNDKYYQKRIQLYFTAGDVERAISLANQMTKLSPMVSFSYIMKIEANYEVAKAYFESKMYKNAIPYIKNILEANNEFNLINRDLKEKLKLTDEHRKKIELAKNWLEIAQNATN